jgi:hypothetical protein
LLPLPQIGYALRIMMRCSLAVVLTLVLAGCANPLANVKNTTAHYAPSVVASSDVRVAEQHIIAGEKLQPRDSLAAISEYLHAADPALAQLRQHPGDLDAMRDYDFALARVFSTIRKGHIDAWSKPLAVPGYVIRHRKDVRVLWNPVEIRGDVSGAGAAAKTRLRSPRSSRQIQGHDSALSATTI